MAWAPSTTVMMPHFLAWAISCFTGLIVPKVLLTWLMARMRVRSEKGTCVRSHSPLSVMGITFNTAPWRSQASCQGTILLWCSMPLITTSSPGLSSSWPKLVAARLMPAVVPLVKMISCVCGALMCARTISRAASCASVALVLSVCTPRCTLALIVA